jgi:hypothetical protein
MHNFPYGKHMPVSGEMQTKCPDQEIYSLSVAISMKPSRTGNKTQSARSDAVKCPERDI